MSQNNEVTEILKRAKDALNTAKLGLKMMQSPDGNHIGMGLRNVLIFGRSVTFVLQNIRGKDERFDEWYAARLEIMKSDPIFSFFRDARNALEKQGKLDVSTSAFVRSLGPDEMERMKRLRPPHAIAFFIGDSLGGSGWEVSLPDGTLEKFYVELPGDIGLVNQVFMGELAEKFLPDRSLTTQELSSEYLRKLEVFLTEAFDHFANP